MNPKPFPKGFKKEEEIIPIFGKRFGDRGRAGYKWHDCACKEMLARALELHPIIYQHGKDHMPPYLKVKFAEDIVHKHQNGVGLVNWAACAEHTNKTHRNRRIDKQKRLEICKEQGVEKIATADMTQIKIDVEPSCMESVSNSKRYVSKVCASRVPTKQEDDQGTSTKERINRLGDHARILELKIAASKTALATARKAARKVKDEVKAMSSNLEQLDKELNELRAKVALEEDKDAKWSFKAIERLKIKTTVKFETATTMAIVAEKEVEEIEAEMKAHQTELAAVTKEAMPVKFGGRPSTLYPWPMFYPLVHSEDV